jgi:hypothetical protein
LAGVLAGASCLLAEMHDQRLAACTQSGVDSMAWTGTAAQVVPDTCDGTSWLPYAPPQSPYTT